MAIHTFTLLYFRCSHPITFKRDTCKEKLKYFSHCPTYKTFFWGSPGYQMCLQDVQTLTAVEHAQKIGFITFILDKLHFTSCKLTEVNRAQCRIWRYWFWILDQNLSLFHIFPHFSVTISTALKLDVAGVLHWQLQFYWCSAAQDVHSHYVLRHRKCNSVSECIRGKEPFKVQGNCHNF